MTNRELLFAPKDALTSSERQRQFVLQVETTPVACPACCDPVDALTAADVDIDAYDFSVTKHPFRCPRCRAELEQVVPFITTSGPGWHWQLKQGWLAERLAKAAAFDRAHLEKLP